jgi:anti-anti-sigma regulatory factor
MKQAKRKRKSSPDATSDAMPEMPVAAPVSHEGVKPAATSVDYSLMPVCTIREGATLKSALLDMEDAERTVVIDVQAVERIDTAALQLLCAFVRERRAQGRRTQWTGNAAPFVEAVEILGLTTALGYAAEKAA